MNLPSLRDFTYLVSIERFSQNVKDVAKNVVADGDGDPAAGISDNCSAGQTVRCLHANDADFALADLLRNFSTDRYRGTFQFRVHLHESVNFRQRTPGELDVYYRSSDGEN